jgi:hypothetical protein
VWVKQQERTAAAGIDFMTRHDTWLDCQNGALTGVNRFDPHPRFVRNGRDLGEWVHRDFTYQAALDACLVLLKLGAPPSGANPYKHSRTQTGFATFGAPYLFYLSRWSRRWRSPPPGIRSGACTAGCARRSSPAGWRWSAPAAPATRSRRRSWTAMRWPKRSGGTARRSCRRRTRRARPRTPPTRPRTR